MEGIPAIIKVGGWHGGTAPTVSKIVQVGGIPAIIKVGGWHGGTAPTVSKIVQVGAMPPCLPCHASSRRFIICVPRNISYLTSLSKFARRGYLETRPKVSGETTS